MTQVLTDTPAYVAIGLTTSSRTARTNQNRFRDAYQSRPNPSNVECCQATSATQARWMAVLTVSFGVDSSNLTRKGRTIRYGSWSSRTRSVIVRPRSTGRYLRGLRGRWRRAGLSLGPAGALSLIHISE